MITVEFYFTYLSLGIQTALWSEWRDICLYPIFEVFSYTVLKYSLILKTKSLQTNQRKEENIATFTEFQNRDLVSQQLS